MSRRARRVAVVAAIVTASFAAGGAAYAGATGRATGNQAVGTASWGATPRATDSDAAPFLDWSVVESLKDGYRHFRLVNTGTATLTAATWNFTVMRTSSSNNPIPNMRFLGCPVPWDTLLGTCQLGSGTLIGTTNGANGMTVTSTVVPAAPGSTLYVRIAPTQFSPAAYNGTLNVSVNSTTQISRVTRTTNS